MEGWIKFEDRNKSFKPKATVSANGYIALSQGALTRFGVDESFKAVMLYFNPETREIGIQPVEDDSTPGARKLRFRTLGADFSAAPFLDRFDIRPAVTTRHAIRRDESTGLLVIGVDAGTARRKGSQTSAKSGGENA